MSKTRLPKCLGRMRSAHFDPSVFEDKRHPPNTTETEADAFISVYVSARLTSMA